MPLVSTNVKLDSDDVAMAKASHVNVSEFCRTSLHSYLTLGEENPQMIEQEIVKLEKQKKDIDLQINFLLKHLDSLVSREKVDEKRESIFELRKYNFVTMYKTNNLDWILLKDIFQFSNTAECKKWLLGKLEEEGLI